MTMHYYALVKEGRNKSIRKLVVNRALQEELQTLFRAQESSFLSDSINVIPFDPKYNIDETELFCISNFDLPDDFKEAVRTPRQVDSMTMSNSSPLHICSIFAGSHNTDEDSTTLMLQRFNKSRLLTTGLTILHQGNTFQRMRDPGLTLDTKLIAAFQNGNLYFRSYHSINPIIDISEYFKEATDGEIQQVLGHPRLCVDDVDAVMNMTDSWMRRRYSAVLSSGILDAVTPRKIQSRALKYGMNLETRRVDNNSSLIFPPTKKEIKDLLMFLNEGFFEGELTGQLFQTNSQRTLPIPFQ